MLYRKTKVLLILMLFSCALLAAVSYAQQPATQEINNKLNQARKLMDNGQDSEAYKLLLPLATSDEQSEELIRTFVLASAKSQEIEQTYAFIEKHYKNKPLYKPALESLVEVSREKKEYALMDQALERLLTISPDSSDYKKMRMESLARSGNPADAHHMMVSLVREILRSDKNAEEKTSEIRRLQEDLKKYREQTEKQPVNPKLPEPTFRPLKKQKKPEPKPAVTRSSNPRRLRPVRNRNRSNEALSDLSPRKRAEVTRLQELARQALRDGRVTLSLAYDLRAASMADDALYMARTANLLVNQQRDEAAELYLNALLDHYPENSQIPYIIKRLYDRKADVQPNNLSKFAPEQWHFYRQAADAFYRIASSDIPLEQRLLAQIEALRYEYRPMPFNRESAEKVKAELRNIADNEGATERVKQEVQRAIQRVDTNWIAPLDRDKNRRKEKITEGKYR